MNCVINQPSYIPWRGLFHQIHKADVFVFYDDVQYTRRSWRNRNRIKTPGGARWLTIPVHSRGVQLERTPIHRIRIDWTTEWNRSHRDTLAHYYRRAPFYARYVELLDRFYAMQPELLADFTIELTIHLARELGIRQTHFVRASALGVAGRGTERVLGIVRRVGATHLVNGPTARAYTDERLLAEGGVSVEYMDYDYPEYPQLHPPFDPHVSILDLLMMVGPQAPRYIWER